MILILSLRKVGGVIEGCYSHLYWVPWEITAESVGSVRMSRRRKTANRQSQEVRRARGLRLSLSRLHSESV